MALVLIAACSGNATHPKANRSHTPNEVFSACRGKLERAQAALTWRAGDQLLALLPVGLGPGCVVGRIGRARRATPPAALVVEATESLSLKCGEASIDNGGVTWSDNQRLTTAPGPSWLGSIAATKDRLHIVWMDARDGQDEIYYKRQLR